MTKITCWSAEDVVKLWHHQFDPWPKFQQVHPYTCDNRENHPQLAGDQGILVPTVRGWICPFCDYTQSWAHGVNHD